MKGKHGGMWMRRSSWRKPPPWWPENERWPPRGGWRRHSRGRFFFRVAGWMAMMYFLSVFACTIGLYLTAGAFGNINLPVSGALLGLIGIILIGLFGLVIAVVSFRRFAAPMGDLLEAADQVAEGDYSVRVPAEGAGEVRSLAGAFNDMTSRLQQHDEQRRELLADITHELRTPLTVIQGNLEGLLDGVYPRDDQHLSIILDETQVMSRLMDDLRTLALAESGALQLQKELTDVGELAFETAAAFRAQADSAGVALEVEVNSALPQLLVDPARTREILANLISNALHYTPDGGKIEIDWAKNETTAQLTVRDSGAGIAAEDLPYVFDRFYKSEGSSGTGLGLAIARDLVKAHAGSIRAWSHVDQGTVIEASFPLPQSG